MPQKDWVKSFPGAVTVCDPQGIIIEMNDLAIQSHADDGGDILIGTNLLGCHPEPARSKLMELLTQKKLNVYTIEKHGIKKMIYQTPWYSNGEYAGFIELSLDIPFEMPHFIRGG